MNNDSPPLAPRLLVVDDQRLFAELIAKIAETVGFTATITLDVGEFLSQLEVFRPSVVTIDLLMPGVDGIELLRELATRRCTARVLLISGFDERMLNSALVLGRELGLDIAGTIAKPVRAGELRVRLEQLKVSC
jgi:DNA-binding response OmpR family regulator